MAESYNFNIANPYQQQQEELARRQKMAEILQQQSFQPMERNSYAGIEAPISPYAGLAKILQAYTGAKGQRDVAAERAALADEARNRSSMEGREFIGALKGTPEIPMPAEEQGGGPGRPAQGPDMARALEMSMNSVNPMVQGAGGAMLTQMLKPSETAFGKVDAKDYTPESVKAFSMGGGKDFSILVPRIKYERENTGGEIAIVNPYEPTGKAVSTIPRTISPDTQATLAQAQKLANRAFFNLNAAQQAQDRREAQRLGLGIQQFNLNKWQAQNPAMSFHEGDNGPVAFNPRSGVATPVVTPTGAPLPGGKPLTESQSNATAYGMRMEESNKILSGLENEGVKNTGMIRGTLGSVAGLTPFIGDKLQSGVSGVMNVLPGIAGGPSEKQQMFDQAKRNFITAVLRKESGASISPSEFENEEKKYFAQPGDTDAAIKQKQDSRNLAIKAMGIQAGPGAKNINPNAGAQRIRTYNPVTGKVE